jgi:hypothetical protein
LIQTPVTAAWEPAHRRRQAGFARVGWAWTPRDSWSLRAGAGVFYMQDTGNPRFDMARNAAGRRQDTSDPLLLNLNWNARSPERAQIVQQSAGIVCISNHYTLATTLTDHPGWQYLFNVQRELRSNAALEIGYLARSSSSSACSTATR